jgi:hypothetical protein
MNGNCSEGNNNLDAPEEMQTEAVGMVVDGQSSPAPEACNDVRPETLSEQHGNGNISMQQLVQDTNLTEVEPCGGAPKPSSEHPIECEDGHEHSEEEDARVAEALKSKIDAVKQKLVHQTKGFGVNRLEMLHASICKLFKPSNYGGSSCSSRLALLEEFIDDETNL